MLCIEKKGLTLEEGNSLLKDMILKGTNYSEIVKSTKMVGGKPPDPISFGSRRENYIYLPV